MTVDKVSIKDVYDAVNSLREDISQNYVTKDAFEPVRNVVYGLVGLILISVVGALIALVITINGGKPDNTTIKTPNTTVQTTN